MAPKTAEAPNAITTNPTDPSVIAANNGSGPTSPNNGTDTHVKEMFNGVPIDWDAPISNAQAEASKAKKGRQTGSVLDERMTKHLTTAIAQFRAEDAPADLSYNFPFFIANKNFKAAKNQMQEALTLAGLSGVVVTTAKHAASQHTATSKAADADNMLIYIASLSVPTGEQAQDDETGDDETDDSTTGAE